MTTRDLINRLADADEALRESTLLAPCVSGDTEPGTVRTRIDGLVREFPPRSSFSGWGIFRPVDAGRVELEREASLAEVERYLELFESLRVVLVRRLRDRTWLAVP